MVFLVVVMVLMVVLVEEDRLLEPVVLEQLVKVTMGVTVTMGMALVGQELEVEVQVQQVKILHQTHKVEMEEQEANG